MPIPKHLLVGAMLGIAALAAPLPQHVHAQTTPATTGPAIYVSEFEVTDPAGMKPYSARVEASFATFGGRYIVRGGAVVSQEGAPSKRIVMIEFPSMERALAWYDSPTYAELKPIRHRAATSRVYTVQGTPRVP
jgi:uncharacterized protein (DUF1330 family)